MPMLCLRRLRTRTPIRANRKRSMTTLICALIVLTLLYVAYRATKPDPLEYENQRQGKHARLDEDDIE